MRKPYLIVATIVAVSASAGVAYKTFAAGDGHASPQSQVSAKTVNAASVQFAKGKTPGQEVFNRHCAACHANGPKFAGTSALDAKYDGSIPGALEERNDLTPEVVRYFVRNGVSIMPGWRKSQITDKELNELAEYLSKKR